MNKKSQRGSVIAEYLMIAAIFTGVLLSLPTIKNLLEQHHDKATNVLSIPG
jgi:hypothetical protein